MKKLLLLAALAVAMAAPGQRGTILPSCDPCTVGDSVVFVGTGYQKNVKLTLYWWQHYYTTICRSDAYGVMTCDPFPLSQVGENYFQIYNENGTQPKSPIISIGVE